MSREVQFTQDDTDKRQAREICRDIAIELIRKAGVQGFEDKKPLVDIADAAIEMTEKIVERFKVR